MWSEKDGNKQKETGNAPYLNRSGKIIKYIDLKYLLLQQNSIFVSLMQDERERERHIQSWNWTISGISDQSKFWLFEKVEREIVRQKKKKGDEDDDDNDNDNDDDDDVPILLWRLIDNLQRESSLTKFFGLLINIVIINTTTNDVVTDCSASVWPLVITFV